MKAIIYARTSSDEDRDEGSKSIPEQLEACRKICNENGYTITQEIAEPDRSGRSYPTGFEQFAKNDLITANYMAGLATKNKTRDGLAKLLKLLPSVSVIVCRDQERLFRALSGSLFSFWLPQQLMQHKVILHTAEKKINYSDWNDLFIHQISSMARDQDVQKRRLFSISKLAKLQDEGYLAGGPNALGYESAGKQSVRINEEEASVIRMIYDMKLNGTNNLKIVQHLNKIKALKRKWTPSFLIRVLFNRPCYFGYQYDSKKRLIKSKVYPAILKYDLDVFKKLKLEHEINAACRVRTTAHYHPYSGIIHCHYCGSRMKIISAKEMGTGKLVFYYTCSRRYSLPKSDQSVQGCRVATVREDMLIHFLDLFAPALFIQEEKKFNGNNSQNAIDELKTLERQLKGKIDSLFDSAGSFSQDTFKRQLERLERQLKEVEGKLTELEAQPTKIRVVDGKPQVELTPEDVYRFIKSKISRITIAFGIITIQFTEAKQPVVIERVPNRNCRSLPEVAISAKAIQSGVAELQLLYKSAGKGDKTVKTLFESDWLKLVAVGNNQKVDHAKGFLHLPEYVRQNKPFAKEGNENA